MSYFKNIALLKAPMAYDIPQPQYVSDLIEICSLAAVVEKDVDSVKIPVDPYSDTSLDTVYTIYQGVARGIAAGANTV